MLLEAAIINLTRNLDILSQKSGQGISSHVKLKEEGLTCLSSILENAPQQEYKKLFESTDHEILIGYLVNILCQIAKNDSSKTLRIKALSILLSLVNRLETFHDSIELNDKCSINFVRSALPGVSSTLFKIIMIDTKLPKNLLVVAIRVLTKFISIALATCSHDAPILQGDALNETCDNIAIRLKFLIEYMILHSVDLHKEVKYEVLNLCEYIVLRTQDQLLSRILESIIKYIAFMTSANQLTSDVSCEIKLKITLIMDGIKDKVQNCDDKCDRLDALVISCLIKLLENLENNFTQMLPAERESELSMLCGFLGILPNESLTIFMEISEQRQLVIKVLTHLTEFSNQQPFLFITESTIDEAAIESCDTKMFTFKKKFVHINDRENDILISCCNIMGKNLDWPLISDILKTDMCRFSHSSYLYITHNLIKGLLDRTDNDAKFCRFTKFMVLYYVEHTQDQYLTLNQRSESDEILKVVIGIETLVTLVELHVKSSTSESDRIILLKTLLCPLLNWASSCHRTISETALSSLTCIRQIYRFGSVKDLIASNVDYIVDGVGQMLENFTRNSEIADVLAITFKLSSIESFYYFNDIYEKIFRLLGVHHLTEKSKSIALLFYRTLSILNEWRQARRDHLISDDPLKKESIIQAIKHDLDIERRLVKLQNDMESNERLKRRIEKMQSTEVDEAQIVSEIQSGQIPKEIIDNQEEPIHSGETEKKKEKSPSISLTEKILTHCIGLMSSNYYETKVLALKTVACGFELLQDDEDTLLPLVHKLWSPLVNRLTSDYKQNLEINLCAFECLVSMAVYAKDFIKKRTLDSIIPRLCLFLESQASQSRGQKEYGPYCMTMAYKCQLRILTHLGALAYHIQLAYSSLWRIIKTTLIYLDHDQVESLRIVARISLHYMIALDSDCVWYFSKRSSQLNDLPLELVYEAIK